MKIIFSLLFLIPSFAVASGLAGQPGAYLRAGVGARALALGNAYVAVAEGSDAALWNPAGLALLKRASFSSSVSTLTLSRQASDAELAMPFGAGAGTGSLAWAHYSLGNDFEGRSSDTSSFYSFGDDQNAYALDYGRSIQPWLLLGLGGKIYEHRIDSYSAYGAGLDLGLCLIPVPGFRIGVAGSDLFSRSQWSTGYAEPIPLTLRIGASIVFLKDLLLATGQVTEVEGGALSYQAGLEGRYAGLLQARIGIRDLGITFGGGISADLFKARLRFDYAFASDPLGEGNIQKFSIGLDF